MTHSDRPVRRRARVAATATVAVLGLLLTGCAETGGTGGGALKVNVDVDTPQLRALKQKAGIEDCAPGTGAPVDGGLPAVTLACLGGGPDVDLSGLRGPMVVNLWASWCGPCREELPYYQELHEKAGDKVAVLGVDYEDTRPDAALDLARQTGVTYPLLADPGGDVNAPLRVRGLPGIVFVDADGTVTHVEYTVIRSYGQLKDLVRQHLGVTL